MNGQSAPATLRASRLVGLIGAALVGAQVSQIAWLVLGSRVMRAEDFGAVLAAQALYAVMQNPLDIGTAFLGGRRSARGEVDDDVRGSLTRTRLTIALLAGLALVTVIIAGGAHAAAAMSPFLLALPLFALLNVWERYGTGDARPFAAYTLLRSAGPAVAAGVCFGLGLDFPLPLAGAIECATIVIVMAAFGLRPLHLASLASRARRTELKAVAGIGVPSILSQVNLSVGTILLSISGANVAAAAFAVALRLLTGLNSLVGVLSTALFPRLSIAREADTVADARAVGLTLRLVSGVSGLALAFVVLGAAPLSRLFLNNPPEGAQATLILALATLPATAGTVAITMSLIARGSEGAVLRPYAFGAAATVLGSGVVLLAAGGDPIAMTIPLIVAQPLVLFGVWRRLPVVFPPLFAPARAALVDAGALLGLGALAAATEGPAQVGAAIAAAGLAVFRVAEPARVTLRSISARAGPESLPPSARSSDIKRMK